MAKIDTSEWKPFIIGDLFETLESGFVGEGKKIGTATIMPDDEHTVPLTAAKNDNNGIMYWGRRGDYTTHSNIIAVIRDGAVSTGRVFAQKEKTGVYSHSYFIKVKTSDVSFATNLFLARVLETVIYPRYTRDDACIWERIRDDEVLLPADADGNPDWAYMDEYMSEVMSEAEASLENLTHTDGDKHAMNVSEWREFVIGDLFSNFVKPAVLHTRQVVETDEGVPYVVRTKFDNGIKCRVQPVDGVEPSPAGVITWGAENATFFYQAEPFLSGRDIYYVDTREYSPLTCMFLASCLQTITHKYPYNFGLFPDLLKEERIKLPVDASGEPDWAYMDEYMRYVMENSETDLTAMQSVI